MANKEQSEIKESTKTDREHHQDKSTKTNKLKALITGFRHQILTHKKLSIVMAATALLVVGLVAFTDARYSLMNLFMSSDVEVTVLDNKTNQPIPQAQVQLGGKSAETNDQGLARLQDMDFGKHTLKISKFAYDTSEQPVKVGKRKQALEAKLVPTGTPLNFRITDFISGGVIKGAKVSFAESDAISDESGQVILSVPPQTADTVKVVLSASGYLEKSGEVTLEIDKVNEITLTPSGKNYFFSKRSGRLDLYAANLDGTNQEVVLAATGKERDEAEYAVSPDGSYVALASTREGARKPNGDLYEELFLFSTSDRKLKKIDTGDASFTIIGWYEDGLYYQAHSDNYNSDEANKLKSYSTLTSRLNTLHSARDIGPVFFLGKRLVLSATVIMPNNDYESQLITTKLDGSDKKVQHQAPGLYGFSQQTPIEIVFISTPAGSSATNWYQYNGSSDELRGLPGEPAQKLYRQFVESSDEKQTAWIEARDGQSLLVLGDELGREKRVVTEKHGAVYPLRWVNNKYLVFRVTANETADYIVAISGGIPQKIANVHTSNYYGYYE